MYKYQQEIVKKKQNLNIIVMIIRYVNLMQQKFLCKRELTWNKMDSKF